MSNLQTEIHTELEALQAKMDKENDLSASDLEFLLLTSLIEEEA